MFRLVVIAGPLKGKTFSLHEGQTSIGRVPGNEVVLQSSKVSKKHCILTIENGVVTVKDAGSSNGTFVNGVLVASKKLMSGDRLSVGEHVLEVVKAVQPSQSHAGRGQVIPLPGVSAPMRRGSSVGGITGLTQIPSGEGISTGVPQAPAPPKDLIEKVKFYFEKYVINFLFTLNEKYQWNLMTKALIALLVVFTVAVSVLPTVEKTQDILLIEARHRAQSLARLMADRNGLFILERNEAKLDISFAEKEEGVLGSYIIDMDGRIMAPGKFLNQMLNDRQDGVFAAHARKWFTKHESYFSIPRWKADGSLDSTYPWLDGNVMGYAEPIKVVDPRSGKNVVVAIAIVMLDLAPVIMDSTSTFLAFVTALVLASLMAVAVYTALYRLTIRPLDRLNQDVDKVLRGEVASIAPVYKMEELEPVLEVMNTALQRIAATGTGNAGLMSESGMSADDAINSIKFVAERAPTPMMVLSADKKIVCINPNMEEITGIRNEGSVGQTMASVARDEAFILMINDLVSKAPVSSMESASDTMEFSGVNYQIEAVGVGPQGGEAKAFVISLKQAA